MDRYGILTECDFFKTPVIPRMMKFYPNRQRLIIAFNLGTLQFIAMDQMVTTIILGVSTWMPSATLYV